MIKQLTLFALTLTLTTAACAQQDSNVSDSVRAMILRSQEATKYQDIGRVQTSVQYEDFLDAVARSSGPQKRQQVESILVEIFSERAELSEMVVEGRATEAQLKRVADFDYLRLRLAPLLNPAELAMFDERRKGPSDAQLKKVYAEELQRFASAMTDSNKDLVLNTLVRHIRSSQKESEGKAELSVDDLIGLQSRAMMETAEELQPQLAGAELDEMMAFLNQLQMNLYMNHEMADAPRQ